MCACVFEGFCGTIAALAGGWGSDSSVLMSLGEGAGEGERPGDRTVESLAPADLERTAARSASVMAGVRMAIVGE